ncbi:helix-turn-helix domain-containing protein [Nisaea nitritireducens]|uniref:helix-turn-helix domain-containing protein n=1 Tax=Nisaea nitritireducens TaxID=568392 RepID=UPI00186705F4|nr:helix-turn-helix domain-containing protein [Nisaea nitritireducens]
MLPKNRIAELRKARGWTQSDVAARLGGKVAVSTVSKLERGDRQLTLSWAKRFSDVMNCEITDVFQEPSEGTFARGTFSVERVTVIGAVAGGIWKSPETLFSPEEENFQIRVPINSEYLTRSRFAVCVRGVEMNRRFSAGDLLVCVRLEGQYEELQVNSLVLTKTSNHNGQIELAIKRFENNGEAWLWPESDHPLNQQPVPLSDPGVEIYGLVIASYCSEFPLR